jgi:CheY-like chemotaxis protein
VFNEMSDFSDATTGMRLDTQRDTVMLVDDDELSLGLAAAILGDQTFQIEVHSSGESAWARLAANSDNILAVVLDRQMPGMAGLEVLMRIKQSSACREVPVVFLSGLSSNEEIARGIAAGAFYYVTKPYDPLLLRRVVNSAISDFQQRLRFRARLESTANAIGLLEAGVFNFRTIEEAQALAELLSKICPNPEAAVTGLWQLLLNAVEHGNLGLTYDDKAALLSGGQWQQEIEQRLRSPERASKYASVRVERRRDALLFRITDQGAGFDPQTYLEFDPERATHAHGRGIAMARLISFDALSYNAIGNSVEATIVLSPA